MVPRAKNVDVPCMQDTLIQTEKAVGYQEKWIMLSCQYGVQASKYQTRVVG